MSSPAQSLGLGAHIYTGPISNISESTINTLEIPKGYRIISLLRIGNTDKSVDAVSTASPRKQMDDVVVYK